MKIRHYTTILATLLLGAAFPARASLDGLDEQPLGSRTYSTIGFGIWDQFAPTTGTYPTLTFGPLAPQLLAADSDSGLPASGGDVFTASLSADMQGSTPGGADRIYQGVGAGSAAFNLSIAATAQQDIGSVALQIKFSTPSNPENLDSLLPVNFFTVKLNGVTGTPVLINDNAGTLGSGSTASTLVVVQWEWSGLSIQELQEFAIGITSPAAGHASVDAIVMDAEAEPLVDMWSAGGGAWESANQPEFISGTGGILYPDASSNSGAILTVTGATTGGIYPDYYYSLFSTPAFTLSTGNVSSEANRITFSFLSNAAFTQTSLALNFNEAVTRGTFRQETVGEEMGEAIYRYTWTWNVTGLDSVTTLEIGWTTPSQHTMYDEVQLAQSFIKPRPPAPVPTPPVVTPVISVDGSRRVVTTRPRYVLKGTVSGNVSRVEFSVQNSNTILRNRALARNGRSRETFRPARGTNNEWSISTGLAKGANRITVRTLDSDGNVLTQKRIVVIRR